MNKSNVRWSNGQSCLTMMIEDGWLVWPTIQYVGYNSKQNRNANFAWLILITSIVPIECSRSRWIIGYPAGVRVAAVSSSNSCSGIQLAIPYHAATVPRGRRAHAWIAFSGMTTGLSSLITPSAHGSLGLPVHQSLVINTYTIVINQGIISDDKPVTTGRWLEVDIYAYNPLILLVINQ